MTERLLDVAHVVAVELRRLASNRTALAMTLVLPAAAATLVAVALGSEHLGRIRLAWTDEERGPVAAGFRAAIAGDPELTEVVSFVELADAGAVVEAVADGDAAAGLVVPPDAAAAGVDVVTGESPLAAGVVGTIADQIGVRTRAAAAAAGRGVAPGEPALGVELRSPGGRRLDPAVYWGPALAAFFVLLGLGHAAQRGVADRGSGVRDRAATSAAGTAPVLVGQVAAGVLVGVAGMAVMAGTSAVVLGEGWGPPLPVAVTMAATGLAVAGVSAVLAAVARTAGQAQTLTAVVAFTLAIGGGSFATPGSARPPGGLVELLPTRVSLDAFSRIITTGDGVTELGGPLLVLLVTAAAGLAAGAVLDRRWA